MNIITQINQEHNIAIDALCDAVAIPRATYYRHQQGGEEKNSSTMASTPENVLRDEENKRSLTFYAAKELSIKHLTKCLIHYWMKANATAHPAQCIACWKAREKMEKGEHSEITAMR